MIRGTTPTVTLPFPFAASTIDKIRIYFVQGSETILTKDEDDVTKDGNNVVVVLTQEETYLFSAKKRLRISARFMQMGGIVGGIKPKYFDVYDAGGADEVLTPIEEQSASEEADT